MPSSNASQLASGSRGTGELSWLAQCLNCKPKDFANEFGSGLHAFTLGDAIEFANLRRLEPGRGNERFHSIACHVALLIAEIADSTADLAYGSSLRQVMLRA